MALDIHLPERPLRSLGDFFLHLFTITCGILIALGLEGAVASAHHHREAREATATMTKEVADNQRGLSEGLASIGETRVQLESILKIVRAIEADRRAKHGPLTLTVSITSLRTTAWDTASATGAFAYMDHAHVERFTGVYALQQEFRNAQQRAVEALLELESWGELASAPLARISDAQAMEAERATGRALAAVSMARDIGAKLNECYQQLLAAKPE